jgi:hypothetical protein
VKSPQSVTLLSLTRVITALRHQQSGVTPALAQSSVRVNVVTAEQFGHR